MDVEGFKRELFTMARDMQRIMHDTVAPLCQQQGVTLQQMHVLLELVDVPGQTSSQLSERAGILRANFSSVCRKLEERGLVERRPSPHDRRSYELQITDEGRELLTRIDLEVRRRYGKAFETEPQETFETVLAGFRTLGEFVGKLAR